LVDSPSQGRPVGGTRKKEFCALCVAVAEVARGVIPPTHNRRLLETAHFIVLPSIGPLVPGHVMVVSKAHCANLASMGLDRIREYESLAVRLREGPFLRDGDPLEAEHGSAEDDKAGACVIHTHVHWIPGMGQFWGEFGERLSVRPEECLQQVGASGGPYIFARASGRQAFFEARGLRSQTIRRILCGLTDRDDTDWMQALRLNWVEETVRVWLEDGQTV
jgi:diadenosine tetraphosphate (Ap4A) HIT family hydrolase